jgi:hypothetical protein
VDRFNTLGQIRSHRSNVRVREPVGRTFGHIRGKFPSRKMDRMIHWESQLERDAVLLFEFSGGVAAYREQPLRTHYTLDGKTRRYTPDFEITFQTGEVLLIEVKPSAKVKEPEEARRLARVKEHFRSEGSSLRIITEIEIRQEQLLANLRALFRYRRPLLNAIEQRKWRHEFRDHRLIPFSTASLMAGGDEEVWKLIDQDIFTCDLRNPITRDIKLKLTEEGYKNEELFI